MKKKIKIENKILWSFLIPRNRHPVKPRSYFVSKLVPSLWVLLHNGNGSPFRTRTPSVLLPSSPTFPISVNLSIDVESLIDGSVVLIE